MLFLIIFRNEIGINYDMYEKNLNYRGYFNIRSK
jgi:hypothetical protein